MFDWQYYLNTYPDLPQNGIHTEEQALQHWNIYGKNEGRKSNSMFDYFLNAKDKLFNIKRNVEDTDRYYNHIVINGKELSSNAISIIMTSSNRSKQTYFTLDSISRSLIKDIQVILVDDSNNDPIISEHLKKYQFNIDLIKINKTNKDWHSPLVNYNIGFKFVKGAYIIIQNAEVCHIGDICNYVKNNVIDKNYYIFDVKSSLNFETNELIYNNDISNTNVYSYNNLFDIWYQSINNNRKYHFLSCMTKNTFDNIKSFSYDCTVGASYDDDDFLLKIISKNINTINVFHIENGVGGIHLFHGSAPQIWDNNVPSNESLFNLKRHIYNTTGQYIDFTDNINSFDNKYNYYLK